MKARLDMDLQERENDNTEEEGTVSKGTAVSPCTGLKPR